MRIFNSGWTIVTLFFLLAGGQQACAQNQVLNGYFDGYGTSWTFFAPAISTEATYNEVTYGGSDNSNYVAEIDLAANLRQDNIPVIPGVPYYLSFRRTRRVGALPSHGIRVQVRNGGTVFLSQDIYSTNTTWGWQCEVFQFTPTTNTITLDIGDINSPVTWGTILDDITIVPVAQQITADGSMCQGGTVSLHAPSFPGNPNSNYTDHTWTGPNGFTATGPDITFTDAQASLNGVYTCSMKLNGCLTLTATYTLGITLQEEHIQERICDGETYLFYGEMLTAPGIYETIVRGANAGDCDKKVILELIVKPLPEAVIAGDSLLGYCAGDVLPTLHLETPVPNVAYQWKKNGADIAGETGPSYATTSPGNYQVSASMNGCQALSDTVTVVEYALPEARIRFDKTDLCILKDTALFTAPECAGCSYFWQPERAFRRTGLPAGAEVKGLFDASGFVVLTVYSEQGCKSKDSVGIIAHPCCEVFAPTAFSPNADGLNDLFMPYLERPQVLLDLNIYNRYGERVYHYAPGSKGWNGTHEGGSPVAGGTYMYYMRYQCTDSKIYERRGDLTLIR